MMFQLLYPQQAEKYDWLRKIRLKLRITSKKFHLTCVRNIKSFKESSKVISDGENNVIRKNFD